MNVRAGFERLYETLVGPSLTTIRAERARLIDSKHKPLVAQHQLQALTTQQLRMELGR